MKKAQKPTVKLWVPIEKENAIKIEEEFLSQLGNAYNTYDCSGLGKYLADNVTYDSTWVLEQLQSKDAYLNYLRQKLIAMQKGNTKTNFVMMYKKDHGKPVLMLSPKTPDGGYGAFTAEANDDGLIKAIHITPADFYAPLICKDEKEYKRFIEIAEGKKVESQDTFGYTPDDPMPMSAVSDEYYLLEHLHPKDGFIVAKKRLGCYSSKKNNHMIDGWSIIIRGAKEGIKEVTLYFDPYVYDKPWNMPDFKDSKMPEGFYFEDRDKKC